MKIAAIAAAVVAAIVAGLAAWLGMFGEVEVSERNMGPYAFVYEQEPSTDFGAFGAITEDLGERLEAAGIKSRRPAQVFFPPGRGIQNQVGFVVEGSVGANLLDVDTFFRNVPSQRYAVFRFPFRNSLSFLAGYFRVEPALEEYRKARNIANGSTMVILDGDSILYLQPLTEGG